MGLRRRILTATLLAASTTASAQSLAARDTLLGAPLVPAQLVLAFRDELKLSDAQLAKLRTLAGAQIESLNRSTAAYLRADGDLLEASRGDDVSVHKAALENRAKVAIAAEVARLQGEKDARAVLTADQRARLLSVTWPREPGDVSSVTEVPLWQAIVTPPSLFRPASIPDSGEVGIRVLPLYADILVDGHKVGSGKKVLRLPIGAHTVVMQAVACASIKLTIDVDTGPAVILPLQTLRCSH